MQPLKSFLIIVFYSVVVISCNSPTPIITPIQSFVPTETKSNVATAIFTPKPAITNLPALTLTSQPNNEHGVLLGTFGNETHTWYSRLAFSPNAAILAQADSSVKLWNLNNQQLIREIQFPYDGEATNIVFSPDGSLLAVSISNQLSTGYASDSHLLVWDVVSGEMKQDLVQQYAIMSTYNGFDPEPTVYKISLNAMAFFPSSTRLAYASSNKIKIKDILGEEESVEWSLGDEMYASEISVRGDSEFLYILMKWYKDITFPALYRWKFNVQIWHPATKFFRREIKFEEVDPLNADMWLVGQYLLHEDRIKGTLDAFDLSTDERKDFPYRTGWKYFNSDASLMAVILYFDVDKDDQGIEIWDTDTWRNIYTFKPSFIDSLYSVKDIAFNSDNSLLAIDYSGQISLWDIRPAIQP